MKARVILFVVAMAAIAAGLSAPAAHAASAVGRYLPASVTCDRITNQIHIGAQIGASEAYYSQNVAYQLYVYNRGTRQWTQLLIDGQVWHVLRHDRVTQETSWDLGTVTTTHPWAPTPRLTYNFPNGTYQVYIRYAWEAGLNSGIWVDANGARFNDYSPWLRTTSYSLDALGGVSDCYL